MQTLALRLHRMIGFLFLAALLLFLDMTYTLRTGPSRILANVKSGRNIAMSLSPRKALFFEIVESGLEDRFSRSAVPRVWKFCQYAKNEITPPPPQGPGHDPCEEFIDGLSARPWWDIKQFTWATELEKQSPAIRAELERVLAQQELFKGDSRFQSQTMGDGWTAFRLQRLGEWNARNVALFPETTRIVRSLDIPLAVRGVMFARQAPGSGVQPHSDGRNFILTAHLGLQVPAEGCWIAVGGERRSWKQDGVIILDTSFTHETGNESNSDRYVLIIDFWHPELSQEERAALEFVYDARNKFESNRAEEIECSYVSAGKPLTTEEYVRAKEGVGKGLVDFFTSGGFIKFNPPKK